MIGSKLEHSGFYAAGAVSPPLLELRSGLRSRRKAKCLAFRATNLRQDRAARKLPMLTPPLIRHFVTPSPHKRSEGSVFSPTPVGIPPPGTSYAWPSFKTRS